MEVAKNIALARYSRPGINFFDGENGRGGINGLGPGTYDVWLEHRAEDSAESWSRVGKPSSIVIDAEHSSVSVELHPPS